MSSTQGLSTLPLPHGFLTGSSPISPLLLFAPPTPAHPLGLSSSHPLITNIPEQHTTPSLGFCSLDCLPDITHPGMTAWVFLSFLHSEVCPLCEGDHHFFLPPPLSLAECWAHDGDGRPNGQSVGLAIRRPLPPCDSQAFQLCASVPLVKCGE